MKTFQEAMQRCVRPVTTTMTKEEAEADILGMEEQQRRSFDVHREVVQHPYSIAWAQTLVATLGTQMDVASLILVAFANGVTVGMDMEKQEL